MVSVRYKSKSKGESFNDYRNGSESWNGELKKAIDDISGDIAGIGDDLIVLVPNGIKIDREKVVGSKD